MNAESLETLFGKISVLTGETRLPEGVWDDSAAESGYQAVGHEYFQQRDQRRIDKALELGTISVVAAQKLTDNPELYRNWLIKG